MKVDATSDLTAAPSSQRTISMGKAIAYFAFSLVINSAGNVLTLVTSAKIHPSFLGAAYWTPPKRTWGPLFTGTCSGRSSSWAS